jgi:hypothetical protein
MVMDRTYQIAAVPTRPRPTKAIMRARIREILAWRLDGAEIWDLLPLVEKNQAEGVYPWAIPSGCTPIGKRALRRYITKADSLIEKECQHDRERLLRQAVAERRRARSRALAKGDDRLAFDISRDLARLQGLYPAEKREAMGFAIAPVATNTIIIDGKPVDRSRWRELPVEEKRKLLREEIEKR